MSEPRDVDSYADEILPVDGPHTPEGVLTAAGLIGELVRRLNHATLPDRAERSLPYPSTVDRAVGQLRGAFGLLPQLLGQLARRLEAFADEPGLYDDRHDRVTIAPGTTARIAAAWLADEATVGAETTTQALKMARSCTVHLGMRTLGGED